MKRKRRCNVYVMAAFIIAVVMIVCLVWLVAGRCEASLLVDSGYERDDFETVLHIVTYGETAWDYAEKYCPEGVDYRKYLDWCAKENGMSDMGSIHYGRSYVFLKLK